MISFNGKAGLKVFCIVLGFFLFGVMIYSAGFSDGKTAGMKCTATKTEEHCEAIERDRANDERINELYVKTGNTYPYPLKHIVQDSVPFYSGPGDSFPQYGTFDKGAEIFVIGTVVDESGRHWAEFLVPEFRVAGAYVELDVIECVPTDEYPCERG